MSHIAPVMRAVVSICLLFFSVVSITMASPPRGARPDGEGVPGTDSPKIINSARLAPPPVAYHLTDTTRHAKRENIPIPPLGTLGEQYALPHGWAVTVSTISVFMTFASRDAFRWHEDFWWRIQIACATQMLNNSPYRSRLVILEGPWELILIMNDRSTVQEIRWSFVYYFAEYMLNWVRNGFIGTGAVVFTHPSGIRMTCFFLRR